MAETKRGPGRPPGSKNKNKTSKTNTSKAKEKAQEIQGRQSGKSPHGGEIIRQQQARQPAQPRQHRSVPDGTPEQARTTT